MEDINNMAIEDFIGLNNYAQKRDRIRNKKPIPLNQSQKDMIERAKERNIDGG